MIYTDLYKLALKISILKDKGKSVGLITGGFDIIHVGHIELLKNAKKIVDFLIVGLDNDKTLRINKGINRPFNKVQDRLEILNSIKYVNAVFEIQQDIIYKDLKSANKIHLEILEILKPDFLFTNSFAGKYYIEKEKRANTLGIKFVDLQAQKSASSTRLGEQMIKSYNSK